MIYANIKATISPSCEQIEPQKEEVWNAESLLEEKAGQPASPEPVFAHQSSPPAVAHPTTSREAFPKENVSNVPLLPQKSTTANDLAFSLPKQQGLLGLSSSFLVELSETDCLAEQCQSNRWYWPFSPEFLWKLVTNVY